MARKPDKKPAVKKTPAAKARVAKKTPATAKGPTAEKKTAGPRVKSARTPSPPKKKTVAKKPAASKAKGSTVDGEQVRRKARLKRPAISKVEPADETDEFKVEPADHLSQPLDRSGQVISEEDSSKPAAKAAGASGKPPVGGSTRAASAGRPDPNEMTLGEHLDDLRRYLIRASAGIFVLMIGALSFSSEIHRLLAGPYHEQVGKGAMAVVIGASEKQAPLYSRLNDYYREVAHFSVAEAADNLKTRKLSFWESLVPAENPFQATTGVVALVELDRLPLEDLQPFIEKMKKAFSANRLILLGPTEAEKKKRLVSLMSTEELGYQVDLPVFPYRFRQVVEDSFRRWSGREPGGRFLQLRPGELFTLYLKLAFLISLLVGFPWVLLQIWAFMKPAFDRSVAIGGNLALFFSTLLFWMGVMMAWTMVFPQTLYYLAVMFHFENTTAQFSISDYYSFFFGFHFGFGIAFQLPIIIVALGRLGIVSSTFLWEKRSVVIVILAIASAVLTPPDVLSQLMLLIPLTILYMISVGLVRIFEKKRERSQ